MDLTELSERLGRSPLPVRDRAKRMLPLDQRGVPGDRVLTQLRKNLLDDPAYDWRHHLAATPPPRPIVNHILPAPRYAGIPGLEDEELLASAEAMAQRHRLDEDDHSTRVLAHEVNRRGLAERLRVTAGHHARQRVDAFLHRAAYPYDPTDDWAMPVDDLTGGAETRGRGPTSPPGDRQGPRPSQLNARFSIG